MKRIAFVSIILLASFCLRAQAQKHVDSTLLHTILQLDSSWFSHFNKDISLFTSYIDSTLEFYHDQSGLTFFSDNVTAFHRLKKNTPNLTRELLKESVEVYAIPNYGAVQMAQHRFCHMENGKMDCGVFKFIHVWKKTNEGWKVTRIISVDH